MLGNINTKITSLPCLSSISEISLTLCMSFSTGSANIMHCMLFCCVHWLQNCVVDWPCPVWFY